MKKIALTVLVLIITQLSVFGQSNNWNSLTEKTYSIKYPDNWVLDNSGQMGTNFFLFSELTSENDNFRENINLITEDLSGFDVDLNKYVNISESQINKMITEANIISSNRIKNNKTEFHKIIFSGKQGEFNLKFEQYYWVINKSAYVLTFTSKLEEFDNFKDVGEKILNSFKIN